MTDLRTVETVSEITVTRRAEPGVEYTLPAGYRGLVVGQTDRTLLVNFDGKIFPIPESSVRDAQ